MICVGYDVDYLINMLKDFKLCYLYLDVILELGLVVVW